jgi:hypothetical protein
VKNVTAVTVVTALTGVFSACAYYNAMWSAERLATDARRLEADGRDGEAKSTWARAAVKAESVMARHPRSRWADDALVLRGEALARSGACAAAAGPLAKARDSVTDRALRERADLAAAECALRAGGAHLAAVAGLLEGVLASRNPDRRSRAAYLAGQAAAARRDLAAAVALLGRSAEPAAGPARVRALLSAGWLPDATALLDTLAGRRFVESDWIALLDELSSVAGSVEASRTLDRVLARARPRFAARARLLLRDGDRLLVGGDAGGAAARYASVVRLTPTSPEGELARVLRLRAAAAGADSLADLAPIVAELDRILRAGTGGGGAQAAQALRQLLDSVVPARNAPSEPAAFRAAELVRDSLHARRLAGRLFLRFAAEHPASLFAAKALVAALPLAPERRDSITVLLEATYAASPYTRALHGEATPTYAAAEDSLARALGFTAPVVRAVASRLDPPRTGPLGPWLDESPVGDDGAAPRHPPGVRPADGRTSPRQRPPGERPERP